VRMRPVVVIIEAAIVWFSSALFVASFLAEERMETRGLLLSEEGNAARSRARENGERGEPWKKK
jgi:hypothetical protein